MNEFIDKEIKRVKKEIEHIEKYDVPMTGDGDSFYDNAVSARLRNEKSLLNTLVVIRKENDYIGKTDIEGEKIYADSSIVELKITFDVGVTFETKRGWFRYCEESLNYEFIVPVNHGNDMNPREKWNYSKFHYKISDLKIIGNMQENPELLETK